MLMLNKTPAAATSSVIALLPAGANRALVRFRMTSSNRENGFVAPCRWQKTRADAKRQGEVRRLAILPDRRFASVLRS